MIEIILESVTDSPIDFKQATDGSAGYDLIANIKFPVTLMPFADSGKLIDTGVRIFNKDRNTAALILPRSGLGHKRGLILANTIGLIDSDYQGPIMVSAWNRSNRVIIINPLDRIAQLIFIPLHRPTFQFCAEFSTNTARGSDGFGSTGS